MGRADTGEAAVKPQKIPHRRLRVRTLVIIRWVALLGQSLALAVVYFLFGLDFAFIPAMVVIVLSGCFNVLVSVSRPSTAWLSERGAAFSLGFDICQLGLLLLLTGGLQNPFVILLLAPLAISAWILSSLTTIFLTLLAIGMVTLLAFFSFPLPWPSGGPELPTLYLAGIWVAMVISIIFMAAYVGLVSKETRRLSDALTATRSALAREQRLAALGGLAAAAAHQLGSPLGTVAVVARELERDLPEDSPHREDVQLLLAETGRCRDILASLAEMPAEDDGLAYRQIPLRAIIELAAEPHRDPDINLQITLPSGGMAENGDEPMIGRHPEIIHGLGTILQNAFQFAQKTVYVDLTWSPGEVSITIADDGPGFDGMMLSQIGEPYFSTAQHDGRRATADGHMGLGIFIARALLSHWGAEISFGNRDGGGGQARILWPRAHIEELNQELSHASRLTEPRS